MSANVPQSPTGELTQEEVFGQQLYIDAEVEVSTRRGSLWQFKHDKKFNSNMAVGMHETWSLDF
jgi:hypothetical protein